MSALQPELNMFVTDPSDPNVVWLEALLDGAQCWMSARDIEQTTGGRKGDRDIRSLASASEWIISGQKGYKHMKHCTIEEAAHCPNSLESQAKKMSERACRLRRNMHKIFG